MAWIDPIQLKLDPIQSEFIDKKLNEDKNYWVNGFAGSGKSVMLVFALKKALKDNPILNCSIIGFTHSLCDMFRLGLNEMGISGIKVQTYYNFVNKDKTEMYDMILCDEVQDLPASVLINMKERTKRLIVAGDSEQTIYDVEPRNNEEVVDPDLIEQLIVGEKYTLRRIHRLTNPLINLVSRLLPNSQILGAERGNNQDVQINLGKAHNIKQEVEYIYNNSIRASRNGESVAILLPRHKNIVAFCNILLSVKEKSNWINVSNYGVTPNYELLNEHLENNGINITYVGNEYGSFIDANSDRKIILMTYASSKGMDFTDVYLPFLSNHFVIAPTKERVKLMVAITRCKRKLTFTYSGNLHRLVEEMQGNFNNIDINEELNPIISNSASGDW